MSTMVCRSCGREIEANSIFCNWCGAKQLRSKRRAAVTVPEPRQLPSGAWHIHLRKENKYFTHADSEICRQEALAYRIQWQKDEESGLHSKPKQKVTLRSAIYTYLASKDNILSPSTIKSYYSISQNRFQSCMEWDIYVQTNDWQSAINDELSEVAPKTVFNAWHLITAACSYMKAPLPSVTLPRIPKAERYWLDYKQIEQFIQAIRGKPCELGALLALNSLRFSELAGLRPCDVSADGKKLAIRGSRVFNRHREFVYKPTNKTDSSTRIVPVVIPRLTELLKDIDRDAGWVYNARPNTLYVQVDKVCDSMGLPPVGVHGLRHSFASLAYHLGWKELSTMAVGGWSNSKIVHEIYTHNADLDADVDSMMDFYEHLQTHT